MFQRLLGKKAFRYRCRCCGEIREGAPSFSLQYPTYYFDVPEEERKEVEAAPKVSFD